MASSLPQGKNQAHEFMPEPQCWNTSCQMTAFEGSISALRSLLRRPRSETEFQKLLGDVLKKEAKALRVGKLHHIQNSNLFDSGPPFQCPESRKLPCKAGLNRPVRQPWLM